MVGKTKKIKFNIIDFFIIFIIILLAVGIFLRYNLASKIGLQTNSDYADIVFIVENIQEESKEYLRAGIMSYYQINDLKFGEIIEILDVHPAVRFVEKLNGDISKTELPNNIDVKGVIRCYGKATDEGFMLNGNTLLAAGKEYLIHTNDLEIIITVLNVESVTKK